MTDVTRILSAIEQGDPHAAEQLLPLVYGELRRLAAQKLAHEKPGQTLDATALVHEAYLRLVASEDASAPRELLWDSRGHFFAAAAEAMRRILVERARRKATRKRGAHALRLDLGQIEVACEERSHELLVLDEALQELERHDPQAARLVKLRFFAGLTHQQAAEALGISRRAADRVWALARAWLYQQIGGS
jgi:RNA polymerase sigma factor (TIGR02999 family)